jgi:hypothetical protein
MMMKLTLLFLGLVSLSLAVELNIGELAASNKLKHLLIPIQSNDENSEYIYSQDSSADESADSDDELESYLEWFNNLRRKENVEKRFPRWRTNDNNKQKLIGSPLKYENNPFLRKNWEKSILEKNQMYKNMLG